MTLMQMSPPCHTSSLCPGTGPCFLGSQGSSTWHKRYQLTWQTMSARRPHDKRPMQALNLICLAGWYAVADEDASAAGKPLMHGVPACMAIAVLYVAPFYLGGAKLPRSHPRTIRKRLMAVTAVSSVAWLPAYRAWSHHVRPQACTRDDHVRTD